jgi:SRSO17 transposase
MGARIQEVVMPQAMERQLTEAWLVELAAVDARLAPHFGRVELRDRASAYVHGLLSGAESKNGWQLAEQVGNATPYGLQHLLGRARWDADAVRDALRAYVTDHLGAADGVLVVDETGFLKKGTRSVGVKRQYSGTAGRIENCQVGVFLAYATDRGRAFLDRELYLPAEWAEDGERRSQANVPETVGFATKPDLAQRMLERALDAGVDAAWVVADAVYGDSRRLGMRLEEREQPYVLALSGKAYVWAGFTQQRVGAVLDALTRGEDLVTGSATGWHRLSAGNGAKGPRVFDWCRLPLTPPLQDGFDRWLLVRRSLDESEELTAYTVFAPTDTTLAHLARVAGSRWQVEIGFEEAKGEVGLDDYEVRSWHGWYRHVTLALVAHAVLAVLRTAGQDIEAVAQKGGPPPRPDSLAAFKQGRGLSWR